MLVSAVHQSKSVIRNIYCYLCYDNKFSQTWGLRTTPIWYHTFSKRQESNQPPTQPRPPPHTFLGSQNPAASQESAGAASWILLQTHAGFTSAAGLMQFEPRLRRLAGELSLPRIISLMTSKDLIPVILPGESHGQRILVGYSLWVHQQSNMTEWLTHRYLIRDLQNLFIFATKHNVTITSTVPAHTRDPESRRMSFILSTMLSDASTKAPGPRQG